MGSTADDLGRLLPAIRSVALAQGAAVARVMSIPVVGMGRRGVRGACPRALGVGAPLVGFGTESFRDPAAGAVIAAELKSLQNADAPATKERMAEAQVEVDMNSSHRS